MPGLVLEGGTFRPIFSSGVMDALLDAGVMFPYCIGVSAGITDGISYVSKQKERNLEVVRRYRNDKRYIGLGNFRKEKSLFGLNFLFGEIPENLLPFDWDTYRKYDGTFLVGVTNALTGEAEYKNGRDLDRKCTMLRATCAVPLLFPAIMMDGTPYYDGGVADPIPIRKSVADGNEKNLIILTRTAEYEKTLGKGNIMAARLLRKKYPKLESLLLNRHTAYNETVRYCNQLEKEGKALIIRPEHAIESMEKDVKKLENAYAEGYRIAMERMDEIKSLF